jgi:hypothetical protein
MKRKKRPSATSAIRSGVYRHYKGQHYLVLGVARHSETEEAFVVYVRLYPRGGCPFWIRPLQNFTEKVIAPNGKKIARFTYVGAEEPASEKKAPRLPKI